MSKDGMAHSSNLLDGKGEICVRKVSLQFTWEALDPYFSSARVRNATLDQNVAFTIQANVPLRKTLSAANKNEG
jgi:hypothetical protein